MNPPPKGNDNKEQTIFSAIWEVPPVLLLSEVPLHKWPSSGVTPCWLNSRPPFNPCVPKIFNGFDEW